MLAVPNLFFHSRKGISKKDSSCLMLKKDLWENIFKAFSFQCPASPLSPILVMLPVSLVASIPPPIWIFFCFQDLTLINRADATLLSCVASTAPGSCSQHTCPARQARRHSQRATVLEPMCPAAKLRSKTTAVWDHCVAGAYPAGQCFGDWCCMFSWLNSLLCLVTMPFCSLELREDFLPWPW